MIPAMTTREAVLAPEADPAEAGFDAERLRRIDRHFDRYVDDGRLPGYLAVVARDGAIVHVASGGRRDLESGAPVEPDTIWRIYSMTKPITTVAAMMLFEEGAFQLNDPVARFIPAFADARVYLRGSADKAADRARGRADAALAPHDPHVGADVRLPPHARRRRDLPRERLRVGHAARPRPRRVLRCVGGASARVPARAPSGCTRCATDVLGRVVEVVSGQSLDAFLADRVFGPLGMTDTAFFAAPEDHGRLAALYAPIRGPASRPASTRWARPPEPARRACPAAAASCPRRPTTTASHTCSSAAASPTARGCSARARWATWRSNHLPGGVDLEAFGRPLFAETTFEGVGFGLGFSVVRTRRRAVAVVVGEFGWGGAASTAFWVDPAERLTVLFLTQLLPSSTHPIRPQLHQLVHQAIVDR